MLEEAGLSVLVVINGIHITNMWVLANFSVSIRNFDNMFRFLKTPNLCNVRVLCSNVPGTEEAPNSTPVRAVSEPIYCINETYDCNSNFRFHNRATLCLM